MTGASDALVSVLFPSGCRICEKLLTGSSRVPICDERLGSFRRMPEEVCRVCGWPVQASFAGASIGSADGGPEDKTRQGCAVCASRDLGFDCARTFGVYEGALVRAIIMLMFERMEPLGAWFGGRLAEVCKNEDSFAADIGNAGIIRLT